MAYVDSTTSVSTSDCTSADWSSSATSLCDLGSVSWKSEVVVPHCLRSCNDNGDNDDNDDDPHLTLEQGLWDFLSMLLREYDVRTADACMQYSLVLQNDMCVYASPACVAEREGLLEFITSNDQGPRMDARVYASYQKMMRALQVHACCTATRCRLLEGFNALVRDALGKRTPLT